jgi:hypothetical protein
MIHDLEGYIGSNTKVPPDHGQCLPPTVVHLRQDKEKKAPQGRHAIAQGEADRRNPGNTGPQAIKPHRGGIPGCGLMDSFALSGLEGNGNGSPGATLSLCPWLLNDAPLGLVRGLEQFSNGLTQEVGRTSGLPLTADETSAPHSNENCSNLVRMDFH